MISRDRFIESTVHAMLVERAKDTKGFYQLEATALVRMVEQAYAVMVESHLRDRLPERSPVELLETVTTALDNASPSTRRTFMAFLRERFGPEGDRR
jgi:hypothetical protein